MFALCSSRATAPSHACCCFRGQCQELTTALVAAHMKGRCVRTTRAEMTRTLRKRGRKRAVDLGVLGPEPRCEGGGSPRRVTWINHREDLRSAW